MIVLGFMGLGLHCKSLGWKLSTGYIFIVIVGIGRYESMIVYTNYYC
jgi:dihydroceramidase